MTQKQMDRAIWHDNGIDSLILKCCIKDGSAVLARIYKLSYWKWEWHIEGYVSAATTRHAAMRQVRAALRKAVTP